MESKNKKNTKVILISCGVLIVVACICFAMIGLGGVGVSLVWPFNIGSKDIPLPETSEATTPEIAIPTEPSQVETPVESDLPEEWAETMDQIQSEVVALRGLSPTSQVPRALITPDDMQDIVANDFFSEYTDQDAQEDVLMLSYLGLLPSDFKLRQFYQDLYSEQIAGFYDDEVKAMYVVQGMGFGGAEKITYAHEYTHVLQDQVYDFENGLGYNDDACEADSERCAGIQALIEGDASLTELLWFQTYASDQDFDELMAFYNALETPVFDSAPPYMAADLYFPYEKGMLFVQLLYDAGGFEAVDQAYQNLPVSTEQILHPEKYPDDTPQIVMLPELGDVLGTGWTLLDQNVMGEWYTYLILSKAYEEGYRLPNSLAEDAAEGWGGDAYAFYQNGETNQVAFIMDTIWDTTDDADEFAEAFGQYADLRWAPNDEKIQGLTTWNTGTGVAFLYTEGDRTLWLMAPDMDVLTTIYWTLI